MIDFSKYVSQFRRPQSYSLGPALRQLRQQDQAQQGIDNQASQYASSRSDRQSQFAAEFAKTRGDDQFTKETDRWLKQQELIRQARAAAQNNRQAEADALVPSIEAFGGKARRVIGASGLPEYEFEESARPTRPELDLSGTRQSIYGGGGVAVPRNPLDPPALPGASAAALPGSPPAPSPPAPGPIGAAPPAAAPPDPGPPPGAAVDTPPGPARSVPPEGAVWLPPGVDPGPQPQAPAPPAPTNQTAAEADLAALNAAGGEPDLESAPQPQPGPAPQDPGQNPFEAPAFSPYRIAIADVMKRNQEGLSPYLEGLVAASPTGLRERMGAYAGGLKALGMTPEASIDASQKTVEQLYGNYRGEVNARAAAGRAENSLEQRREDKAWAEARDIVNNEDVKAIKRKLFQSKDAYSLLESAHNNPQSARDLIKTLYRMKDTGVMTDRDFDQAEKGIVSLWGMLKDRTLNKLFKGRGGLNPTQIDEIRELLDIGTRNLRNAMMDASDKLYEGYKSSTTDGQRAGWKRAMTFLDRDYWPEEFKDSGRGNNLPSDEEFRRQNPGVVVEGEEEEPHLDSDPTSGPPPLGDNLGVAPLPAQPKMGREPNRAGATRGSNVPPKPPRKRRTLAEIKANREAAEKELAGDATQP